jgi:hypothetical protein
MAFRMRVLAGCFALGVGGLLLTGTAAQAAPLSGAHHTSSPTPAPTWTTQWTPSSDWTPSSSGWTPSPKPTCTQTPTPAPTPTTPPAPQVTTSATAAPSGGANTGGGGSIGGGGNGPLAAGGAAVALVAGGLGLLAFRRWRRARTVA